MMVNIGQLFQFDKKNSILKKWMITLFFLNTKLYITEEYPGDCVTFNLVLFILSSYNIKVDFSHKT